MLNPLLSATFASIPIADPSAGRCLVFPTKLQPRRANRQLPRNPSTNLVIELSQAWTFILAPIQTTAHLEQAKKRYTQRARKKIFRDDPENFYFWEINPPPGFFSSNSFPLAGIGGFGAEYLYYIMVTLPCKRFTLHKQNVLKITSKGTWQLPATPSVQGLLSISFPTCSSYSGAKLGGAGNQVLASKYHSCPKDKRGRMLSWR